jgi:NTE family protein
MDTPEEFIESLFESSEGRPFILDPAIKGQARKNTQDLLKIADDLWDAAIAGRPKLRDKIVPGQKIIDPKYISEARRSEIYNYTPEKRGIIDLVQQGGGMYGIALVGYTYIMEKAGIRFYSLGGTSAGAINTILLGALPASIYTKDSAIDDVKRQSTKSELLAYIIANTEFSKFMDRGGIVGWLQKFCIRNMGIAKAIFGLLWLACTIGLYAGLCKMFSHSCSNCDLRIFDFVFGIIALLVFPFFLYLVAIRILGENFGLNTGQAFYDWITSILRNAFIKIDTTAALFKRMAEENTLDRQQTDEPNTAEAAAAKREAARILFISSNLSHNRIVKFPQRAVDYWNPSENVNPAAYVRASMSIPFVFETFVPDEKHVVGRNNMAQVNKARFVDGGMLSNFPIREFHNHTITYPRFPTFGVLLSERSKPGPFDSINLWNYIGSFIATFRNFYDNDFLQSSEEINMRVEVVDTKGFDWLDFWMKTADKQKLFKKGAEAAIRQLERFDFEEYKKVRRHEIQQSN